MAFKMISTFCLYLYQQIILGNLVDSDTSTSRTCPICKSHAMKLNLGTYFRLLEYPLRFVDKEREFSHAAQYHNIAF